MDVLPIYPAVRGGKLQVLERIEFLLTLTAGVFGSRHDRAGLAVADAAAVEEPERLGDHRRVQHLLHRHFAAKMGLGILRPVRMTLHRDMRHRAVEVILADTMGTALGAGKLGEGARRRSGGADTVAGRSPRSHGKAATPGH